LIPCSYACVGQTARTPTSALEVLKVQLTKSDFLNSVVFIIFGMRVDSMELTSKKRAITDSASLLIDFQNCNSTNLPALNTLLVNLVNEIVPNAPNLGFSALLGPNGTCSVSAASSTESSDALALGLGIGLGVAFLLLILILLAVFLLWRKKNTFTVAALPEEVAWIYENFIKHPRSWEYSGTKTLGFYRRVLKGSMLTRLNAMIVPVLYDCEMELGAMIAICNPALVTNFINQWKILSERAQNKLFHASYNPEEIQRLHVLEFLHDRSHEFPWNKDIKSPIMLVAHGTDFSTAEKICETGFANLSLLDKGYFGKGIYVTTYFAYTLPYLLAHKRPAVLLSWAAIGSSYPVYELPTGPGSLLGTALKSASHYVVVTRNGLPVQSHPYDKKSCDEIVLGQEGQISPFCIIEVKGNSLHPKLIREWNRPLTVADLDRLANEKSIDVSASLG